MTRRTAPQWKRDKHSFPITLRIMVPERGLGALGHEHKLWDWLALHIGHGEFAETPHRALEGDAVEFHFRCLEDALAFHRRFPMLVLADDTMSATYTSPHAPFGRRESVEVCNLYTQTTAKEAMRRLMNVTRDLTGNIEPGDIYPDRMAPIVRNGEEGRELVMARWGLPTPPQFLIGRNADRGVTNVRNTRSPHWRRWLGPESRCLVPFTKFAEPRLGGNAWFSLSDDRPAFFAGLQVPAWTSVRKVKDGTTTDDLFAFLTCDPNAEVAALHPKAMPVILTRPEDWETWMEAPWPVAALLQRKLPDGLLRVT